MAIALTTSTAFTEGSLKVKVLNFVELKTNFSRIFGTKNRKANAAQAGHMDGLPSCLKRTEEEAVRHGQAIAAMPGAYETYAFFRGIWSCSHKFSSCFHKYSSLGHLCFVQSMFWSNAPLILINCPAADTHHQAEFDATSLPDWTTCDRTNPQVFEVCEFELFDDGRDISQKSKIIQIGSKLVCSKLPWGRCFVRFFPSAPHCRNLSFCSQTSRLCNQKKTKKTSYRIKRGISRNATSPWEQAPGTARIKWFSSRSWDFSIVTAA